MDIFDNKNDPEDDPFVRYQSEQQDHSDLNKTILFISMASFTIVLFFVIGLYLYARCIFTRQSRNRRTTTNIHRLTLTVLPVSEPQPEPPNTTGLDPNLIASLPTFTVQPKILEAMECAVCLGPLEGGETAKVLPDCKHVFHLGCIDTWLGSHATCPLCRARVQVRLQPQNREGPVSTLALDGGSPLVLEATSSHGGDDGLCELCKNCDSNSRLSSFRRILSGRERSSRRIQPSSRDDDDDDVDQDLERQ